MLASKRESLETISNQSKLTKGVCQCIEMIITCKYRIRADVTDGDCERAGENVDIAIESRTYVGVKGSGAKCAQEADIHVEEE